MTSQGDSGFRHAQTLRATADNEQRRRTRKNALRRLASGDGADLDVAVVLGLTTDAGAEMLRRALGRASIAAATPADPAGCAECQRTSPRGCWGCSRVVAEPDPGSGLAWARKWREGAL